MKIYLLVMLIGTLLTAIYFIFGARTAIQIAFAIAGSACNLKR